MWLEVIGAVATVLAVVGTVLNARKRRSCFYVWLASNSLTVICHVSLAAYSLALRDAIFLGLAIYGLIAWRRPSGDARRFREQHRTEAAAVAEECLWRRELRLAFDRTQRTMANGMRGPLWPGISDGHIYYPDGKYHRSSANPASLALYFDQGYIIKFG